MPAVVNVQTAKVITRRIYPLLDDDIFLRLFDTQLARSSLAYRLQFRLAH
jgi:hypothetical protein